MIARLRGAAERRPVTVAVVVGLAFPIAGAGSRVLIRSPLTLQAQLPREAVGAAFVLLAVWLLGWQRRAGLTVPLRRPANLLALLAMVTVTWALDAAGVAVRGVHDLAWAALLAVGVGVTEETLTRGIIQGAFQGRGPVIAVGVSSVYFGLLHLGNLLIRPDAVVIAQAASALLIGLLFGAVRWRIASVWPLALTHALVDLPPLATGILVPPPVPSPVIALVAVVLVTPWAAIGVAMLAWDEARRT